jgi:hypothetical protein
MSKARLKDTNLDCDNEEGKADHEKDCEVDVDGVEPVEPLSFLPDGLLGQASLLLNPPVHAVSKSIYPS